MFPYVVVGAVVLAGILLFVAARRRAGCCAPAAPTTAKLTTYESGVDPVGDGWAQTNVRYFLYAYLYVIFAVDAVYLFPWATVIRGADLGAGHARRDGHLPQRPARRAGARRPPRPAAVGLRCRLMPTSLPMPRVGPLAEHAPRPIKVVLNWGRRYSLWVFNFGLACCAIEFIAASMARHDFIRLGVIPFAPGPRQADLMVVSGTVTDKMAPAIRRLYDQMPEPKYVISFGACSNSGGPYWDSYCVTKGVDQIIPVDVYVPGLPAAARGAAAGDPPAAGEDRRREPRPPGACAPATPGRRRAVAGEVDPPAGGAAGSRAGGDASAAGAAARWRRREWGSRPAGGARRGLRLLRLAHAPSTRPTTREPPGFDVVLHLLDTGSSRHRRRCARLLLRTRVPDGAAAAQPHRPVGRRRLARARDARDVRHRLRRLRRRHRPGAAAAAAARGVRGHPAAQVVRARRPREQAVAGRQGAGGGRRRPEGPAHRAPRPPGARSRRKVAPPGCPTRRGGRDDRAGHAPMSPALEVVLRTVAVLAAFLVLPLLVGQTEHKVMAHMQGRLGPMYAGGFHGWAQLVADGVKFVQKEDVVPAAADRRVFRLAPGVALVPYLVAMTVIPLSPTLVAADVDAGALFVARRWPPSASSAP